MALATFSVRMDEDLKKQFDFYCKEFGMNTTTAINVFAKAVVREKRIPFDIQISENAAVRAKWLEAFLSLREQARQNGVQDWTLEEINEEIRKTRNKEQ